VRANGVGRTIAAPLHGTARVDAAEDTRLDCILQRRCPSRRPGDLPTEVINRPASAVAPPSARGRLGRRARSPRR
jgi:hypothetical protein